MRWWRCGKPIRNTAIQRKQPSAIQWERASIGLKKNLPTFHPGGQLSPQGRQSFTREKYSGGVTEWHGSYGCPEPFDAFDRQCNRNRRLDWLTDELVSHTLGVLGKQRRKDEPRWGVFAGVIDDDHSSIAEFAVDEQSESMHLSRR